MESFKDFFEHSDFIDFIINEVNEGGMVPSAQAAPNTSAQPEQKEKLWSAKKPEILQMWTNLRQDTPIVMTPITDNKDASGEHSTYGEDGIRITGSWYFISSILSRLKEIIAYENPQKKLRLVFRGVDKSRASRPDRQSYVFYCNLENRNFGKPGRPRSNTSQFPKL
jgi:hypothetical protein